MGLFSDRYSRHVLYKNIGKTGQKKLQDSYVVVVGLGSLGGICAELLARAGIGRLKLIDRDIVELSNLHRQFLFCEEDIGHPKAESAKRRLSKINSNAKITASTIDLTYKNIDAAFLGADLIIGSTDNAESRLLINDYAVKHRVSWLCGSAAGDKGYVYLITPGKPCYRCIFNEKNTGTCETEGIFNAAAARIGSVMASEAIKFLILGAGSKQAVFYEDIWERESVKIKTKKNKDCLACAGIYEYLSGEKGTGPIKLCGTEKYHISGKKREYLLFLEKNPKTKRFGGTIILPGLIFFQDGRAIIDAKNEKEARIKFSREIGT